MEDPLPNTPAGSYCLVEPAINCSYLGCCSLKLISSIAAFELTSRCFKSQKDLCAPAFAPVDSRWLPSTLPGLRHCSRLLPPSSYFCSSSCLSILTHQPLTRPGRSGILILLTLDEMPLNSSFYHPRAHLKLRDFTLLNPIRMGLLLWDYHRGGSM